MFQPNAKDARRTELKEAIELLEKHPGYAKAQLEYYERGDNVTQNMPPTAKMNRTPARMDYVITWFDLWAETHVSLVSDIASQNAFIVILHESLRAGWEQFTGCPYGDYPTEASPKEGSRIERRAHYWIAEGYRRLTSLQTMSPPIPSGDAPDKRPVKTISDRLDDAAEHERISHEEQAHRIGISRTAYFEVKAGRGGKKSRRKTENYLANVFNKIDKKSGPNQD